MTEYPLTLIGVAAADPAEIFSQGELAVLMAPDPLTLWKTFSQTLQSGRPLAVLPPSKPAEKAALLAQLPEKLPSDIALTVFTSGSTGAPKAVLHSEQSIKASGAQLRRAYADVQGVFSALPAWGMGGIAFNFLLPYYAGIRAYAPADRWLFTAPHFVKAQKQHGWELTALNPYGLRLLCDLEKDYAPLANHRFVSLTAALPAQLRREAQARFASPVEEIYGMTELAGPILREGISLGPELSLSPEGELLVDGPSLLAAFAAEGKLEAPPRPYPTGDLARFESQEGCNAWKLTGRSRELINVGGKKVPPGLVEAVLGKLTGVRESCAFGIPDQDYGERVGVLFVADADWKEERWREFLGAAFSFEQLPVRWKRVEALPRSAAGKIFRPEARRILLES